LRGASQERRAGASATAPVAMTRADLSAAVFDFSGSFVMITMERLFHHGTSGRLLRGKGRRMSWMRISGAILLVALSVSAVGAADQPAKLRPKEALQAFNNLIGAWRGTGEPEGTRQQKKDGFWQETITWEWQLKNNDAWLKVDFDKGKFFTKGELRYLPEK